MRGKPPNAATGEMAGEAGRARRGPAAVQRLQDSADEKPGEARDRRSGGGDMGFLAMGYEPVGTESSRSTSRGS